VTRDACYIAALAALSIYFLIFPVWRAQFLLEIWPTESWNAYFQFSSADQSAKQTSSQAAGIRAYNLKILPMPFELIFDNFHTVRKYHLIWRWERFFGVLFESRREQRLR
jgi:hypothetical protein